MKYHRVFLVVIGIKMKFAHSRWQLSVQHSGSYHFRCCCCSYNLQLQERWMKSRVRCWTWRGERSRRIREEVGWEDGSWLIETEQRGRVEGTGWQVRGRTRNTAPPDWNNLVLTSSVSNKLALTKILHSPVSQNFKVDYLFAVFRNSK